MKIKVTTQEERKRRELLNKQLKMIEKQEDKMLARKENPLMKKRITPVLDKIQDKIPEKLKNGLNTAFYRGFVLVFDKGNSYIEKTYQKNKLQLEYDLNNYAVDQYLTRKRMKNLDKAANQSKTVNASIAVLEGGVLGFLGIGLPDIPLFLSVIIRTINEISLSYGYDYNSEEEKAYILSIICAAITREDKQRKYDEQTDHLGTVIDADLVEEIDLKKQMRETANVLSDALLTAKFIQGIPFVGVVGGIVNHTIIRRVSKYAMMKYKKRYLLGKVKEDSHVI